MYRWMMKRTKVGTIQMCQEMGLQPATACALSHRGAGNREEAERFLYSRLEDLSDPLLMKDMKKALALVEEAVRSQKKIAVYGDYDVDGVMSTTILTRTIRRCGGNVVYYVPHRQKEGYGLNCDAVRHLAEEGVSLLFTCDNGIAAMQETKLAKELGMEVVVLDHHEPGFEEGREGNLRDILPTADAVVDPKQRLCNYPFRMLCAAGISYKFSLCLLKNFAVEDDILEKELLCFAAVATVCDIVDLLDENRVIVKAGLAEIQHTTNTGLRVLLEETGLGDRQITEYHLGFVVGPCINATGRLESGRQAVELFCETEENKAREIARRLKELNEERKELTREAVERITAQVEADGSLAQPVLVLYDHTIHESVAGIVAGRIKEKYYRPVILITDAEDGAKGSGRSIEGYHLFEALFRCRELFTRFGGHAMAAGLSLPHRNIPLLRERLNAECTLTEEDMVPVLRLEKQLSFGEIHLALAKELRLLAPFGKENPAPLFASKGVWVKNLNLIGKEKDILKMTLMEPESGRYLAGISFDGYPHLMEILKRLYPHQDCDKILHSGQLSFPIDIVYRVEINSYGGRDSVQLNIQDFRIAKQGG